MVGATPGPGTDRWTMPVPQAMSPLLPDIRDQLVAAGAVPART